MTWLHRFGSFWYDFLVGDRWELFIGPIAALALAWLLVQAGLPAAVCGPVLFSAVALIGAFSVLLTRAG